MTTNANISPFGNTQEYAWTLEFLERCFPTSGTRVMADMNLAMAMCKAEPKNAQTAMQMFAQNIRQQVIDAEDITRFRFALGVLFTAYWGLAVAEGRCKAGEIPAELEFAVRFNPEILECANELGQVKFHGNP